VPDEQIAEEHAVQDDTPQDEDGSGRPARYIPDWERLDAAVNRMAACGFDEGEATEDLCRAIADCRARVRVTLAKPKRIFSGGNVRPPAHLQPTDLDWEHSRPSAP
jgi:hypothetical protein